VPPAEPLEIVVEIVVREDPRLDRLEGDKQRGSTSGVLGAPTRIGPLITMGLLIRGFRAVVLDLRSSLGFRGGIRESPAAESSKASVLAVFLGREDFRRARVKVLFTKLRLGEDAGGEEAEGKTSAGCSRL